ncbi:hypothetical protein E4U48_008353, partial [Claviceps purpurea]
MNVSSEDKFSYPIVRLTSYKNWHEFIETLKSLSISYEYWENINPDLPDLATDVLEKPVELTPEGCYQSIMSSINRSSVVSPNVTQPLTRSASASRTDTSTGTTTATTATPTMSMNDAVIMYNAMMSIKRTEYKESAATEKAIRLWISASVEKNTFSTIVESIVTKTGKTRVPLRMLVRDIRTKFSPGSVVIIADMSSKYNALLKEAHLASMSPDRWLESWHSLYPRAVRVGIPELQGPNAVRDFLSAVGARFEPEWAHTKNVAFLQYTDELPESMDLLHLHDELKRFRENNIINQVSTGKRGVHATLGNQSDKFANSTHYECPCEKSVGHFWKPEICRTLRQAISGEFNGRPTTISKERCDKMKQAYESAKWNSLREKIQKHGWNQQGKKAQSKGNLPGGMAAAILDPGMFEKDDASQAPVGVYTTLGSRKHMLSMSTLYDNCGAMHV